MAEILAESPRGASDLYVAMTRPTQRLVVVHADALPQAMTDLVAWPPSEVESGSDDSEPDHAVQA